jgi:hypothetical protein
VDFGPANLAEAARLRRLELVAEIGEHISSKASWRKLSLFLMRGIVCWRMCAQGRKISGTNDHEVEMCVIRKG